MRTMGSFAAFSPPHSCDICQKFVLYNKNRRWWYKALESPSGAEGLLSKRARDWMLEEMGPAWTASDIIQPQDIVKSLTDIAVFDCTLGEARLAAKAGCKFCLAITNKDRQARRFNNNKSDAESFLAGLPSLGLFGVLRWACGFEKDQGCFEVTASRAVTLEILVLSGKLAFPSNYSLV